MCRQYNDYGIVLKDQIVGNLSSVKFPEFWEGLPDHQDGCERNEMMSKADSMWVAEYERECCMRALMGLDKMGLDEQTKKMIKTFVDIPSNTTGGLTIRDSFHLFWQYKRNR